MRATAQKAKPFLKWAGGKGQLLSAIEPYYPFANGRATKYAEPFIGGGAVLFDILSKYTLQAVYISDINAELITTYRMLRDAAEDMIALLSRMQKKFIPMPTEYRKAYYLQQRDRFNALKLSCDDAALEKAALMIFLNKTCFNGLFRVNKKGLFNVPFGSYKNPVICDAENLRLVAKKLHGISIECCDYTASESFIDNKTFVYFDPPYRPLTKSSSFTAYTENSFNDTHQIALAKFVDKLNKKGAYIIVSNSDPQNSDADDAFFDTIYAAHTIRRIPAYRMINCNSTGRGKIHELLISNY